MKNTDQNIIHGEIKELKKCFTDFLLQTLIILEGQGKIKMTKLLCPRGHDSVINEGTCTYIKNNGQIIKRWLAFCVSCNLPYFKRDLRTQEWFDKHKKHMVKYCFMRRVEQKLDEIEEIRRLLK